MMILVKGRPDSGKSVLAEKIAMELPGKRLYLATMIPYGEEGAARVKKHRAMREGKGFHTLEIPSELPKAEEKLQPFFGGVCLLECVANLAGNEMHAKEHAGTSPEEVAEVVLQEIRWLKMRMEHLVVVTNHFEVEAAMDGETRDYIRLMELINRVLETEADRVEGTDESI